LLVNDLLVDAAAAEPGRLALVCGGDRLTFEALDDRSNRLAAGLCSLGVKRGDRVVTHLENSVESVVSLFAVLKAGAVFVPVGRTVKAEKLGYILNDCTPAAFIADTRPAVLRDALERAPSVRTTLLVRADDDAFAALPGTALSLDGVIESEQAPRPAGERVIDLDLAALVYTSGSSGRPKGVMLNHANVLTAVRSISSYLENTSDDVILDVLPLSFDYGLYQVFLAFAARARLVLERSFVYPVTLLERVVNERVTALPIVPTLGSLLLRQDFSSYDLSSLRYITSTGAALPPSHISELRRRLPQVRIFSMYGLTECKRVSFLHPDEIDRRPTSVGKPMENVEVFVASDDGVLSHTGTGELVVRGSNVMQGYWHDADETARVLKPAPLAGQSLLYTGDTFRIDDEGYMYFEGRRDDLIKSRGQRVSPKEVENVLYELRGVTGAVVVGVHDPIHGSLIKAFVSVEQGFALSEPELLRHCAERLEDFAVPRTIEFVDRLPVTDSGKILRRPLAATSAASSVTAR
jgi:amino acid adenylation domain-containing protein